MEIGGRHNGAILAPSIEKMKHRKARLRFELKLGIQQIEDAFSLEKHLDRPLPARIPTIKALLPLGRELFDNLPDAGQRKLCPNGYDNRMDLLTPNGQYGVLLKIARSLKRELEIDPDKKPSLIGRLRRVISRR